ncbi:MFS transporter [Paenibacillus sp. PDC88]|uniref:MFS transporter n=1 Tax=Paenibacillus sp. PDC88 TaxID=1884375 RepID=UPI00089C81DE|nr:MFS transporter [Paenibacillus sp. PDC88]SDW85823.1 MFS transporter, PPP family, 3-phenylpropionic acid transporter [Paenibacillus sp. PDC88]
MHTLSQLKLYNFFVYGAVAVFTSFFSIYLQNNGLTKLQIGTLMAIGPFVSLFANPFWGFMSDRSQNIRKTVLLMLAGTLVFVQAVFLAPTYSLIFAAMIFFYFFQSPLFAQTNSMILVYIDGTNHKFGSFRLWGSLGWALTAVAAGPVMDRLGDSGISIVFSVLLLTAIFFAVLLPQLQRTSDGPVVSMRGFGQVVLNPYFMTFIILGVLVSVPNAMNSAFVSLYITELGGSKQMVGLAVFMSSILEVAVFLLFDRFLKRKMTVMLGCLTVVSILFAVRWELMALATDPLQIAFIQLLHSVTFGGYFYVGTQLTMLFIPRPYRSSGQALYTLSWGGVSGVIAGIFGGFMFQNFGASVMYQYGVILSVIGIIGFGIMFYIVKKYGYQPPLPSSYKVGD